eukprot:gene1514-14621_t
MVLPNSRQGGNLKRGGNSGQNGWYQEGTKITGMPKLCDHKYITVGGANVLIPCTLTDAHMRNPWRNSPLIMMGEVACGGGTGPDAPGKPPSQGFEPGDGTKLPPVAPRAAWKAGSQ